MPTVTHAEGPIGAEVRGIDLAADIDAATFGHLRDLLHERGVIVVRDQRLSEGEQVAFAVRFGPLQKILFSEHLVPGYPELFLVSNINPKMPLGAHTYDVPSPRRRACAGAAQSVFISKSTRCFPAGARS